jgi:hypothetical protein
VSGSFPPHFGRHADGSPESAKLSAKFIVVNWRASLLPGIRGVISTVKKAPASESGRYNGVGNCNALCALQRLQDFAYRRALGKKLVLAVWADYFGAMSTEARVVSQSMRSVQAAPL